MNPIKYMNNNNNNNDDIPVRVFANGQETGLQS